MSIRSALIGGVAGAVVLGGPIGMLVGAAEIKSCYRKLAKEHHLDRLMAQGMPEEFIRVATEKLATINLAYDQICKERGIK